jgi:hypothetical protein
MNKSYRDLFIAIVLFGIVLGGIGLCNKAFINAAKAKEVCPKWEIDPPVHCEEAPHVFDSDGTKVFFMNKWEAVQMCDDGTSVTWHWDFESPHYKRDAWRPMFSYDKTNTRIRFDCFILGKNEACAEFQKIINDIVECQRRNRAEEE